MRAIAIIALYEERWGRGAGGGGGGYKTGGGGGGKTESKAAQRLARHDEKKRVLNLIFGIAAQAGLRRST